MTPHVVATLTEIRWGFLVGADAGGRCRLSARPLAPRRAASLALPGRGPGHAHPRLAPLLVLWLGTGLAPKVVICALIVFFPVAVATMVGIRSVDARLLELGRSLRATRWQIVRHLELPAALPQILGGLRVGATLAVIGAIVGEWAGADRGLGVLINLARGQPVRHPVDVCRPSSTIAASALSSISLSCCSNAPWSAHGGESASLGLAVLSVAFVRRPWRRPAPASDATVPRPRRSRR